MKKLLMVIITIFAGTAFPIMFLVAQDCIQPTVLNPADVPFVYEEQQSPIAYMVIETEKPYTSKVYGCDPDNELITITPITMPVGAVWDVNNESYTWVPDANQIGIYYLEFEVSDMRQLTAKFSTAKYMLKVEPCNAIPYLLPKMDPFVP